jgi:hypothetical protein
MAAPKLKYSIGNAASTTLSVASANSDTSMTITSDTNFAAKSGEGMVLIDESQATEEIAYSTGKTGAVLATPLANRGLEGGSAQGHAINATVKGILTAGMWNDLIDSLSNVLNATTGAVDTTKVVDLTTAQTLTNKRLTSPKINENVAVTATATELNLLTGVTSLKTKVVTTTDDATAVIDVDVTDQYQLTAVANDTVFTVTGTPVAGQKLIVRLKDAGVAKNLTWTGFTARGATPPTVTVAGKTHYVGAIYNATASTFDCVAAIVEG